MLSQKAILVNLSISQWGARKNDKHATLHIETQFSTQSKVGNFSKNLMPGAHEFERIKTIAGSFRKFFIEQTLPWFSDGTRILSSKNYVEFTTEYRKRKDEFNSAVSEFIESYSALREDARNKLGDLFRESDYPSETKLLRAFQCNVIFQPVPEVTDFRTEILDVDQQNFRDELKRVQEEGALELWNRLFSVVKRASETLNKPDAIFRDSLLENVGEICALLPRLNVTDDTKLTGMLKDVESVIAKTSPDLCRVNPSERHETAKKLDELTEKMGAFMGALGGAQ